ncbi:hypothetical protein EUGRSUZ_L01869, partial [Eucalyptus grandis]
MRILGILSLFLLLAATVCHGDDTTVEVVGAMECSDCAQRNVKLSQAFSGIRVSIECKTAKGKFEHRAVGELDGEGKFQVSLPEEMVEGGKLKEECYAQLHSAQATPCPAHDGLESSKIVLKSKANGKHTFGLSGKLKIASSTCASAFFWPFFKYPPFTKLPPVKDFGHPWPPFPPKTLPPFPPKVLPPFPPIYKKPLPPFPPKVLPPFPPIYKKPLPPFPPIYKKPLPPPVPFFKKPLPPPIPVFKKPLPPPVP